MENQREANHTPGDTGFPEYTAGADQQIPFLIKNLPTERTPGLDGGTWESYQTVKEELVAILHKRCDRIEKKGIIPTLFYKTSIILTQK